MNAMITMNEVARRAGVSQATVSRVVNRNGYVSDEVARSVAQAMQDLEYKPRSRKKSRASVATPLPPNGLIALIMLDDTMESHPSLALAKLRGVEAAAAKEGLTVALARVDQAQPVPSVLKRKDLVGVLLWGVAVDSRLKMHLGRLPLMWLSSHAEQESQVILVGNEQAGQLAAKHLRDSGVRNPAFLCPPTRLRQCGLRANGFRYDFHLAGIESQVVTTDCPDSQSFEQLDHVGQSQLVGRLVDRLLELRPSVDGVFIPDDQITCLAYKALLERGVRPGRDLAIVSCGNESVYLRGLTPRPTTIDLAPETTGRLAVEQLLRRIRHPEASERTSMLVMPKLVPGDQPNLNSFSTQGAPDA